MTTVEATATCKDSLFGYSISYIYLVVDEKNILAESLSCSMMSETLDVHVWRDSGIAWAQMIHCIICRISHGFLGNLRKTITLLSLLTTSYGDALQGWLTLMSVDLSALGRVDIVPQTLKMISTQVMKEKTS